MRYYFNKNHALTQDFALNCYSISVICWLRLNAKIYKLHQFTFDSFFICIAGSSEMLKRYLQTKEQKLTVVMLYRIEWTPTLPPKNITKISAKHTKMWKKFTFMKLWSLIKHDQFMLCLRLYHSLIVRRFSVFIIVSKLCVTIFWLYNNLFNCLP